MEVEIDSHSGFCFGVRKAIATLEEQLAQGEELYCVGDIVHNEREIDRLRRQGLKVIEARDLGSLQSGAVLFRAHGEPPQSYATVRRQGLRLTDATCPVVLKLQERIREACRRMDEAGGQVVIYGKKGHAEVIGLMGQTDGRGILIENEQQAEGIDASRPTELFAQTTKSPQTYTRIADALRARATASVKVHDTICRQMAARADQLPQFAAAHDVIVFVGGTKSSNSKALFDICQAINPRSHFVTHEEDVRTEWFASSHTTDAQTTGADAEKGIDAETDKATGAATDAATETGARLCATVGVTGATSTPLWLMENVKARIEEVAKRACE